MKKGYYIHFNARDTVGVSKKIDEQLEVFGRCFQIKEINIELKSKSYLKNIGAMLPFGSLQWNYKNAEEEMTYKPDFIYVRKPLFDRQAYFFFLRIKTRFPECKLLMEVHSWPYSFLFFSKACVLVIKDRIYASRIKQNVDRYITYTKDDFILGVPTIKTKNGINVDKQKAVTHKDFSDNEIHIIAVAIFQEAHGYERLLYGLSEYYQNGGKTHFYLHMIGDGAEKKKYQEIIKACDLCEYVFLEGIKKGTELEKEYEIADLAAAVFGLYKIGLSNSSALKTREYLAKGLPIITGCKEDAFEGSTNNYCLEFPNDESWIDFCKVEEFYHELYDNEDKNKVALEIRQFAKKTVDMEVVMRPIVGFIRNQKGLKYSES